MRHPPVCRDLSRRMVTYIEGLKVAKTLIRGSRMENISGLMLKGRGNEAEVGTYADLCADGGKKKPFKPVAWGDSRHIDRFVLLRYYSICAES